MNSKLITLKGVSKVFKVGEENFTALHNINLEIDSGAFMSFVGPSGSGKTTLLNLIGGLDVPSIGNIFFKDKKLSSMSRNQMARYRRENIGFIFQTYNLLPVLTARENVEMPLLISGISSKEAAKQANEQLEAVGLLDWSKHKPGELSGGQRQRVAIARALVNKPAIVWADEPTGNLDSNNEKEIMELLSFTNDQYNQTIVLVTHSDKVAAKADRIIQMEDGLIVSSS